VSTGETQSSGQTIVELHRTCRRIAGISPAGSRMTQSESLEQRFLRAVEAIYAAATEPDLWPQALQKIADCTGDAGSILIFGRDDGSFGVIASDSLKDCLLSYQRDWSDRDIRAIRCRERGYFIGRDVVTDRDVITADEMKLDPFYSEFLPKFGLKYFAASMVSPDPHVEVALSVQRSADRPEFNDDELELLGRVGPHVERALRLSMRLNEAELSAMGLGEALARIGIGVFILDSLGRVVFSNPAGNALLGNELDIANERLVVAAPLAKPDELLGRDIGSNLKNLLAETKPVLIRSRQSNRPLAIYVLPVDTSSQWTAMLTHAKAVVLAVDTKINEPPDASLVRDIFGLTLSEARVSSLIGSGMQPSEVAVKLGIAQETVRSTLKRVFAKLDVSRQSELAVLMTKLMLR
jgi:DNA-binding CsgD family transcriptional regulator/GAF domain-containing protein